ncbi:MAG: 4Fe-4S binding protein [Helicobacteraceae bacterium]|nr:4Fe-4S binding protein [Helicobacteraceae bacterium]
MLKAFFESFLNLFKRPATVGFPFEEAEFGVECRGGIRFNAEHCTRCLMCEKICPTKAIQFIRSESGEDAYHYNPYLCIFCGECTRSCPKENEALFQSNAPVFSTSDQSVSKSWDAVEIEAERSKKIYKKAKIKSANAQPKE